VCFVLLPDRLLQKHSVFRQIQARLGAVAYVVYRKGEKNKKEETFIITSFRRGVFEMIFEDWVAFGILAHEMFSEGEANGLEEQFLILYYKTAYQRFTKKTATLPKFISKVNKMYNVIIIQSCP